MAKQKKKTTPNSTGITPDAPDWLRNSKFHVLLIAVLSFLLYANTLGLEYALDDAIVITENEFTKEGLKGIPDIFAGDTFLGFFGKEKDLVAGGRYRPLSLVTFAIEYELFKGKAFISHLGNILLYIATCTVLYFLLLIMMTPVGKKTSNKTYYIALIASLLFVAHPLHTEAIANIKGRDEIMTLLGSLGAMLLLWKWYKANTLEALGKIKTDTLHLSSGEKTILLASAGLVFFLGLMSKENAITFLAVIPLSFYVFGQWNLKRTLTATAPILIASVVFLIIRQSILGAPSSGAVNELMNNPFVGMSFSEKYATITYTLGKYLVLLAAPISLTHDYYPKQIATMHFSDWQVMLSLLVYAGMSVYALFSILRKELIGFCIFLYIATLSIVSNLVIVIGTTMAERFIFIPSIGFCIVLALFFHKISSTINKEAKENSYKVILPALILSGVVLALYSIRTITRNPVWKNNFTLFTSDVVRSPNSAKLRNACGGEIIAYAIKPENEAKKEEMLKEAIVHLDAARSIHPTYVNAYLLLGNAHYYLKEYEKGLEFYKYCKVIDPQYKEADNNLLYTYREGGKNLAQTKPQKAIEFLNLAIELEPLNHENFRSLAIAYKTLGNAAKERESFIKMIKVLELKLSEKANDVDLLGQIASSYGNIGDFQNAIVYFEKLIKVEPQNAQAHLFLGQTYQHLGQTELGQQYIQKAIELKPELGQR